MIHPKELPHGIASPEGKKKEKGPQFYEFTAPEKSDMDRWTAALQAQLGALPTDGSRSSVNLSV